MARISVGKLIKGTFQDWGEDKGTRLAAALAYYTIFSVGPILVVLIAVAGLVFGPDATSGQIGGRLSGVLPSQTADFLQTLIKSASEPAAGIIATVIGIVTLLFTAAGIFGQLKDALNTIWEVAPAKGGGIVGAVVKNAGNFVVLLGVALLLIASLVVNALFAAVAPLLGGDFERLAWLWNLLNYVVSLALLAVGFAALFRFLPDVRFAWKDALTGGGVTALLFVLGQVALGIYMGLANVGSAFGAAASLVVLLVWIYYSSIILLLGAEFTQVYANTYGSQAVPKRGASFVTEEARAQQGTRPKGRRTDAPDAPTAARPGLRTSPWFR
jgi:membrane protein